MLRKLRIADPREKSPRGCGARELTRVLRRQQRAAAWGAWWRAAAGAIAGVLSSAGDLGRVGAWRVVAEVVVVMVLYVDEGVVSSVEARVSA